MVVAEIMTSHRDESVVTETSRVYRVHFVDGQVLDFVTEVSPDSITFVWCWWHTFHINIWSVWPS